MSHSTVRNRMNKVGEHKNGRIFADWAAAPARIFVLRGLKLASVQPIVFNYRLSAIGTALALIADQLAKRARRAERATARRLDQRAPP